MSSSSPLPPALTPPLPLLLLPPLQSILDFSSFTIRVPEAQLADVVEILKAIDDRQLRLMQVRGEDLGPRA